MRLYTTAITTARRAGLGPDDVVVAGVSGGPDSCTLMRVLRTAAGDTRFGFAVQPAHLMHDFRGQETRDDADFVRRRWPECIIEEVDVAAYQREHGISSFEQAARDLRYDFLARVARQVGARLVAVGHTADDLAETVLLHVARGSGLHGLRGMSELDPWPYPTSRNRDDPSETPLKVWRPLIELTRRHTIAYCRNYGIDYRDDSTNYMRDFARNRVRLDLMPALKEQLNPRIADALGRLSRTAAAQVDYMEQQADLLWPQVALEPAADAGILRLDRAGLAEAHPALRHIILRRAWVTVTGHEHRLTERHLAAMADAASNPGSGKIIQLPRGFRFVVDTRLATLNGPDAADDCPYPEPVRELRLTLPWGPIAVAVTRRDGWEVTAESVRVQPGTALDTGNSLAAYLSSEALAEGATVRTWQPGDRMQPLGMSGTRKLQDIFTDARIPRHWRERIPLVVTPRGIAWIVGSRIADWAAVRPEASEVAATFIRFDPQPPGADSS
ncbi:MAG: tRNA lysidine(34) synthetase TilS [Chloroflexota bacterium]|nr:tRNA lysidine(34) synthetase TilS [Chloroflexota bacterium]MDE2958859.1 tRNA lysidine(34) synthetase TilS [Chloroflexota bacterium]